MKTVERLAWKVCKLQYLKQSRTRFQYSLQLITWQLFSYPLFVFFDLSHFHCCTSVFNQKLKLFYLCEDCLWELLTSGDSRGSVFRCGWNSTTQPQRCFVSKSAHYSTLKQAAVSPVLSCTETEQRWHKPRTMVSICLDPKHKLMLFPLLVIHQWHFHSFTGSFV